MKFFFCCFLFFYGMMLLQPTNGTAQKHPDKNFELIDDFTKNGKAFRADTTAVVGHSTEGGKMITYHADNKNYLVIDIWLYGETGKVHYTYWTDKDLHFKIVKRTLFTYDKPFTVKGYKTTETTEYFSYHDSVKHYDVNRHEVSEALSPEAITEIESSFNDLTKDIVLKK